MQASINYTNYQLVRDWVTYYLSRNITRNECKRYPFVSKNKYLWQVDTVHRYSEPETHTYFLLLGLTNSLHQSARQF